VHGCHNRTLVIDHNPSNRINDSFGHQHFRLTHKCLKLNRHTPREECPRVILKGMGTKLRKPMPNTIRSWKVMNGLMGSSVAYTCPNAKFPSDGRYDLSLSLISESNPATNDMIHLSSDD
jgi:hypothetical protein